MTKPKKKSSSRRLALPKLKPLKKLKAKPLPQKPCQQVKKSGERCGAFALSDSAYCFAHDPSKADMRKASCRKGGLLSRSVTLPPELVDKVKLDKAINCVDALEDIYHKVQVGMLSPNVGKVMIQAVQTALNVQGVILDEKLLLMEIDEEDKEIEARRGKDQQWGRDVHQSSDDSERNGSDALE